MKKTQLNPEEVKAVLKEVLHQNPGILRSAVIEVLEEKKAQFEHLDRERQIEIEEIVRRDFERYESVFRALAKEPE